MHEHITARARYATPSLHVRNPSGHTQQVRNATLPGAVFAGFYAERAIFIALTTS